MAGNWKLLLIFGLLLSVSVVRIAAEEDAPAAGEAAAADASDDAEDIDEDYSEADKAHLIVRKYFKEELGVQGRNLTVYLEIYNAGSATANEVALKDSPLPEGLKLIDGSLEAHLGKVDVGSSVQHSYVVVAEKGSFGAEFQSATVTYQPELDNKEKQTTSSSVYGIYVMTPVEQITRYALLAGSYASLGMATTPAHWRNIAILAVIAAVAIVGNNTYNSVNSKTSERKRAAALKELEKEQ
ncbi:translocon-associated protein beta-domain-containing protein [Scenedesmus sp. NREL 46B-D3]|nr:translocon-associated protein beta-domain-containing protein [Scenedesmus sp. NREL 46B-D3]